VQKCCLVGACQHFCSRSLTPSLSYNADRENTLLSHFCARFVCPLAFWVVKQKKAHR
jgi:hypothetical protein